MKRVNYKPLDNNVLIAMNHKGKLKVTLDRTETFSHGDFKSNLGGIVLTVSNDGCTIIAENLQKFFELFIITKETDVVL